MVIMSLWKLLYMTAGVPMHIVFIVEADIVVVVQISSHYRVVVPALLVQTPKHDEESVIVKIIV